MSTERYWFDFRFFGLVRPSLYWLVLGLADVEAFYYHNAEQLRMHIEKFISA